MNWTQLLIIVPFVFLSAAATGQSDPDRDGQLDVLPPGAFGPNPSPRIPVVITTPDGYDNFDLGIDFAEPHMASNPLDPLQYFNAFNTNGTHHTEDGHDWATNNPSFPSAAGDPVAAYDSLGNLYYMTMRVDGPNITGAYVVKSTNNGLSWSPAVTAVSGFDKCWMAADQTMGPYGGNVYATMTANGGGNFSRTTDGGTSWQNTWFFNTQSLPGMMVAVGPDAEVPGGCVYVVTNSGSSTAAIYTFYRSTNGGTSFTQMSTQTWAGYLGLFYNGRNSVEGVRTRPYPFIAADNSYGTYRGRLYCVYATNNPAGNGNKPDIYCRYSDDQGATWSSAVIINDDASSQNNHNWFPSIWCDQTTGRLYAKWFDSRNSQPLDDSTDVYASYSDDGGQTWAPNQKITNRMFRTRCTTCGGGGDPAYQGDYDAITSNADGSMLVWSDFRYGAFTSMTAYFPDYAMLLSSSADTAGTTGSSDVYVHIPDVRLYEDAVTFSATVEPSDGFTVSWPEGDTITSFPDSIPLHIAWDGVAEGTYTVTVTGRGPNGTPVHKRELSILATNPFVTITQPNGGESMFTGTTYPVIWNDALVDTVKLEYSTDNGLTWTTVADSVPSIAGDRRPPKLRAKAVDGMTPEFYAGSYNWLVPFTASDSCLIRISDFTNPSVFGVSQAVFSIVEAPAPRWRAQTSPNSSDLYSVSVVDSSRAWAAGAGGTVLKTLNGNTWTATIGSGGADVYTIEAIDISKALIGTFDGTTTKIRRTQNGGLTWTDVYTNSSAGAFIDAIEMFDANNGYAVGDPVGGQWTLLRTTDGGLTWTSAASLSQNGSEAGWNNAMWWTDSLHGWFGTSNGRVYATADGGATWSPGTTSFTNSYAVAFQGDGMTGLAAGDGLASSADGGTSWSDTPAQPPGTASALSSLDPGNVVPGLNPVSYLVTGQSIYRTMDQGGTLELDHGQTETLNDLSMTVVAVDGTYWVVGHAVGNGGTIVKYTELLILTDAEQVSGEVPQKFSLSQNYPNPFNPSTSISYGLPEQSYVRLRVFNMLGQNVRTLVSGAQGAGTYEVVWDGKNAAGQHVSSGLYFYRLEATPEQGDGFVSLRKMLMLK